MRPLLVLLSLALTPAFAGDTDFNGRWNIKVLGEPRNRAWWLQVEGAGTPQLRGKFVGFPGGDMNDIQQIELRNGELYFSFVPRPGQGKKGTAAPRLEYRARLQGKQLQGTFESPQQKLQWVGMRAPEINEKDDGSWREGKPVHLFNHKDLSGWQGMVPGKELGWKVEDGILKNAAGSNNLVSDATFWNYKLHIEYKVGDHSNSGIGLRGRYEVQILEDYGREPNTHTNGALYSRIPPAMNASKPAGEWQTFDIRLVGRNVKIVLNGKTVVDGVIEGLTAVANNPDEGKPGPISLQGDHGPVEFRNIVLTPLVKK